MVGITSSPMFNIATLMILTCCRGDAKDFEALRSQIPINEEYLDKLLDKVGSVWFGIKKQKGFDIMSLFAPPPKPALAAPVIEEMD